MEPVIVIVLVGVAGVGKTTVGQRLAAELGWTFRDADELHSPASVERMRQGRALAEAQRGPWLDELAGLIARHLRDDVPLVLACSALRRAHRRALLARAPDPRRVRMVYLRADPVLLALRLEQRTGHFFPAELLADQLATLEPPGADEPAAVLTLDAAEPVAVLVGAVRRGLGV